MKVSEEKYNYLRKLAKEAWNLSEVSWDSEETISAENLFFEELARVLTLDEWNKLETYCLKATNEERLAAGLGYLEKHMFNAMPWVREFGRDYEVPAELFNNPEFEDLSWHNDVCPSFCLANAEGTEDLSRIWVNHIKREEREYKDALRFIVAKDNDWQGVYTLATDDVYEAITELNKIAKE